jgi:TRIAD3 protein (E3 ubiquitin-protein ligase RNF216)
MDMSNCSALFPETELARALSSKSLELYFRLKIAAELVLAGIEGLETCPACDYAVVIDNPDEKLFVCVADGCKQVSCRKCRNRVRLHCSVILQLTGRSTYPNLAKVSGWTIREIC